MLFLLSIFLSSFLVQLIRYHELFEPEGTNVTFSEFEDGVLHVRTYERGVEDETLACGTGVVAAGLVHAFLSGDEPSIAVRTRGGDEMEVRYAGAPEAAEQAWMRGPAAHVCQGTIDPALLS